MKNVIYTDIYTYIYIYIQIHIPSHIDLHIHKHIHKHLHKHIYMYIYIYIFIYIYIYISCSPPVSDSCVSVCVCVFLRYSCFCLAFFALLRLPGTWPLRVSELGGSGTKTRTPPGAGGFRVQGFQSEAKRSEAKPTLIF